MSRPVVQPLPPPGVADLNGALGRLARNPQDVGALVDAGTASLKLGDIDAAIGFFSRADGLAPGNARAKAGLAAAHVRSENPFDALLMFDEAERAGASGLDLAGDRGLAHDLVGDNVRAQDLYRKALAGGRDDEVTRRLALSLAISGDRIGAEAVLRPLLDRRDLSAYRTRAFVLAILGDIKGAMAIADVRLPRDLASRIAPYLRYMPKLTPAQQAAAANFGHFPKVADIGRDDPRIAGRPGTRVRTVDAGLIPSGEPLGKKSTGAGKESRSERRQREEDQTRLAKLEPEAAARASAAAVVPTRVAVAEPVAVPVAVAGPSVSITQPSPPPPAVAAVPTPTAAPPAVIPAPPLQLPLPPQLPLPLQPSRPPSVAEAFADMSFPPPPTAPAAGAVDLTKIKPKRDPLPEPKAAPTPPKVVIPSRIWVQLGTGRNRAALGFDWRRFSRDEPELFKARKPYVAKWGQTNRMLTGPFPSDKEAQAFLRKVRAAKFDAFAFTSDEGEAVDPLRSGR